MGTQRVRRERATEQKTKPKIQKEGHVRTQEGDSHLQAKKRSPRRNQPFSHLDLRRLASKTVRKWGKKKKKLSHAACSTLLWQPLVNEFRNGAEVL